MQTHLIAKLYITSLNSHFASSRFNTKYGSWFPIAKVWIKVCNANSQGSARRVYISTHQSHGIFYSSIYVKVFPPEFFLVSSDTLLPAGHPNQPLCVRLPMLPSDCLAPKGLGQGCYMLFHLLETG